MEGANESTELRRHPKHSSFIVITFPSLNETIISLWSLCCLAAISISIYFVLFPVARNKITPRYLGHRTLKFTIFLLTFYLFKMRSLYVPKLCCALTGGDFATVVKGIPR